MKERFRSNFVLLFVISPIIGVLTVLKGFDFIHTILLYGCIVFIYVITKYYLRQRHIISIINDEVNPDLFLKEIQVEIDKTGNKKQKNFLLVNKSAGLFYKGDFISMLKLLESIDPSSLNLNFRAVYYNNLVLAYLSFDRLDDSNKIMEKYSNILTPAYKIASLNTAIKSTKAVISFYNGNLSESKKVLSELIKEQLSNCAYAFSLFYLGQIYLKEGNTELGIKYLKEAATLGEKTFISRKVDEFLC